MILDQPRFAPYSAMGKATTAAKKAEEENPRDSVETWNHSRSNGEGVG
jgi:hypothetical protein